MDLAFDCAELPASEEGRLLRGLIETLRCASWPQSLAGLSLPEADELERLLASGAAESAALRLIGDEAGCMLSRGPGGLWIASVILPGHVTETNASGETLAMALAGALALALADPPAIPGDLPDQENRPALRLN